MSPLRVSASSGLWDRLVPWLGAALGALWFLLVGGGPTINPTNLDWVGGGDTAQHVLGWLHFRNAPWSLPLGRTPSLMYPLFTTVGYTDSNPWVSVALKPFSRWLPQDFQFIGLWFLLCFSLQGWMGVKLMELVTPRRLPRLLGAALFVMSPVLLFRTGHDTLCAHWLILATLWLCLRPRADRRAAWRSVGVAFALNVLAAGIHPYLEVMVFTLTAAMFLSLAKVERLLSWRSAGAALAGVLVAVGGTFVLFGYVGQGVSLAPDSGFGHFSSDMLTLINPMGWSRLLPGLPIRPGQYEGFGYLGTGSLALAVVLLWKPWRWWPRAKAELKVRWPVVLVVSALAVFAFSTVMTVAGKPVISMRSLAEPLLPLLSPFRASGRFIWVFNYAVLTGILALIAWRLRERPHVLTGLLLGAVLLQALDTHEVWKRGSFWGAPWPRLQAPAWESLDPFYRHIALVPPSLEGAIDACVSETFPKNAYVRFGDLAYRRGMTTNSVYSARLDAAKVHSTCEALRADVRGGRFSDDTLYVVGQEEQESFRRAEAQLTCGVLDGYTVCVSAKEGRFREALLSAPKPFEGVKP